MANWKENEDIYGPGGRYPISEEDYDAMMREAGSDPEMAADLNNQAKYTLNNLRVGRAADISKQANISNAVYEEQPPNPKDVMHTIATDPPIDVLRDGTEVQSRNIPSNPGDHILNATHEPTTYYYDAQGNPGVADAAAFADTGEPWTKVYDARSSVDAEKLGKAPLPQFMPPALGDMTGSYDQPIPEPPPEVVRKKPIFATNDRDLADKAAAEGKEVYFVGPKGTEKPANDSQYKKAIYVKSDTPPGQKPSDTDIKVSETWPAMRTRAVAAMGGDPATVNPMVEAQKRVADMLPQDMKNGSQWTYEQAQYVRKLLAQEVKNVSTERNQKMSMLKALELKHQTAVAEEIRYRRNQAEKKADKVEDRTYREGREDFRDTKRDERDDKRDAKRIEAEDRREDKKIEAEDRRYNRPLTPGERVKLTDWVASINKEGKELSITDQATISDMAARDGNEFKKVWAGRSAVRGIPGIDALNWGGKDKYEWQLVPKSGNASPSAPPGPKTVTIDGKQYKDGDTVTKDGKQFRVKVK